MIIAEVGINHLGDINLLKKYILKLNRTNVDAITFQILNKKFFYDNNLKKYYIPKKKILNLVFKYSKKKIGLVIDEVTEDILKFKKKISFFKIIGSQANKTRFLESIKKISKMTYISNRNINKKTKNYLVKLASSNKKINIIHTQFKPDEKFVNLQEITNLYNRTNKKPAFGLHCKNKNVVFLSTFKKPESIFFYIKDNKKVNYPDDEWAVKLNDVDKFLSDTKFFMKYIDLINN